MPRKKKLRKWKQVVIQEVAYELPAIKQAHQEAAEAQKYGFQLELEKVKEEFQQVELHLTMLEYKGNTLKSQKQTPEELLTPNTLATKNIPIIPSSIKPLKGKKTNNHPHKSYAQMATSGSAKIITKKFWTEVIGTIQRQKATTPSMPKVKPEKKSDKKLHHLKNQKRN